MGACTSLGSSGSRTGSSTAARPASRPTATGRCGSCSSATSTAASRASRWGGRSATTTGGSGGCWSRPTRRFRTDLTSVPWLFTWLVPRTGRHLPAALLHDGLVGGADDPPSYVSEEGHVVARDEADRVFRDAMGDLGTGAVRRWLVWAAVAVATIVVGSQAWSRRQWWHYRVAAVVTIGLVVVLGTLATLDLVDAGVRLPWMGDRAWPAELVGGFAGAVAIPSLLGAHLGPVPGRRGDQRGRARAAAPRQRGAAAADRPLPGRRGRRPPRARGRGRRGAARGRRGLARARRRRSPPAGDRTSRAESVGAVRAGTHASRSAQRSEYVASETPT